jgi:hypothetical protein
VAPVEIPAENVATISQYAESGKRGQNTNLQWRNLSLDIWWLAVGFYLGPLIMFTRKSIILNLFYTPFTAWC